MSASESSTSSPDNCSPPAHPTSSTNGLPTSSSAGAKRTLICGCPLPECPSPGPWPPGRAELTKAAPNVQRSGGASPDRRGNCAPCPRPLLLRRPAPGGRATAPARPPSSGAQRVSPDDDSRAGTERMHRSMQPTADYCMGEASPSKLSEAVAVSQQPRDARTIRLASPSHISLQRFRPCLHPVPLLHSLCSVSPLPVGAGEVDRRILG